MSENLTKKMKDLMIVSGLIAALIMGFYGSLVNPTELRIGDWINLLLLSEGMMLLTVIMCIWSNRVEFQRTVLIGSNLIENSKTDFEKVKTWTKATSEDYHAAIIDEYIQCLGHAEDKIARNANSYKWNITVFTIGLISLSICLPIVLTLR